MTVRHLFNMRLLNPEPHVFLLRLSHSVMNVIFHGLSVMLTLNVSLSLASGQRSLSFGLFCLSFSFSVVSSSLFYLRCLLPLIRPCPLLWGVFWAWGLGLMWPRQRTRPRLGCSISRVSHLTQSEVKHNNRTRTHHNLFCVLYPASRLIHHLHLPSKSPHELNSLPSQV